MHRETAKSPALAYWNTTEIQGGNSSELLERGVDYRFLAGPHPATGPGFPLPKNQCPVISTGPVLGDRNPCRFGFGAAAQQRADAYVHNFYNFAPPEGCASSSTATRLFHKGQKLEWYLSIMGWKSGVAAALLVSLLAGCSEGAKIAATPDTNVSFDDFQAEATPTTGIIRGVVFDEAIRPLVGANVTVISVGNSVTTNDGGLFLFDGLESGTYFLQISKQGYNATQSVAEVVAGVDEPDIVKVLLQANPSEQPYYDAFAYTAFITCGAAIVATSVGCNTIAALGTAIGDRVYFDIDFTVLPRHTQGELVWKHTQPAGGQMIWEIVSTGNTNIGYRETTGSPALAYMNETMIVTRNETMKENGITYRIFGGPHELCKFGPPAPNNFGCGATINQKLDVFVHNFYNFVPTEGWRFTKDGHPVVPQ